MKYWIADIEERNGEFEYTTPIRFKAKTMEDAVALHMKHVSTWYGKDNMTYDVNDEWYYNGYVAVGDGTLTEIDEHTYAKLSGHYSFPDMSEVVR
tara:strand:+ start:309 stop:593 length:285 start_codon:yes stop_codon:yes gene_type:complete